MQDNRHKEQDRVGDAQDEQSENMSSTTRVSRIQSELKDLVSRKLLLKKKTWNIQSKGTVPTGLILSGIGGASLLMSYILTSSILTFIGLGLTFWGVLIIYISSARHVHSEVLSSVSSSMQKSIGEVVSYMGYSGEVIFFHPKSLAGLGQGQIFISHYTTKDEGNMSSRLEALNLLPYSTESSTPSIYLHPKGMFLTAPGQGLVDLVEKELGINLATVDLSYVQQALPKLLIEDLKMVDEISIEDIDNNSVVMSFAGGPCTDMCTYFDKNTKLGSNMGCPLCSATALIVSKVTGKPVMIKETKIASDNKISTTFSVMNP